MTAKDMAHLGIAVGRQHGSVQAGGGGALVVDVAPALRRIDAGVHQQQRALAVRQRQPGQKLALRRAKLVVRPLGAGVPVSAHRCGRADRERVVVALQHYGPLAGQRHHGLHHLRGLATVAHQVAQQRQPMHPQRSGMRQAGV